MGDSGGAASSPRDIPRIWFLNFGTLLLLLISGTVWMSYSFLPWWSPWIAVAAALVAQCKAAWAATAHRKILGKRLQRVMLAIAESRITFALLASALLFSFFMMNHVGVIRVTSQLTTPADVSVLLVEGTGTVERSGSASTSGAFGAPVYWAWWFRPVERCVEVVGLPAINVTVSAWNPVRLTAPRDFMRPVLLIRPTFRLIDEIRNDPMTLQVEIGELTWTLRVKVAGQAVWIGCGEDVAIPPAQREAWVRAGEQSGRQSFVDTYWLNPHALPTVALATGDSGVIRLKRDNCVVYAEASFTVDKRSWSNFPQVVDIDVPTD